MDYRYVLAVKNSSGLTVATRGRYDSLEAAEAAKEQIAEDTGYPTEYVYNAERYLEVDVEYR